MNHMLRDSGAKDKVANDLAQHLAAANMLGRLQVVRRAYKLTGKRLVVSQASRLSSSATRHFSDEDAALDFSLDLPPTQSAIDYIRNLTPVTKATFDGLTDQYRKMAFTIAGITDDELLKKIRDALADTFERGGTKEDFEAAVAKITSAANVPALTANAIDNTFANNVHAAYSLGRLEQMSDPATRQVLPVWQYWTVGDDRVRPEHAVLQGFAAQAIDPVWRKIYPPSGYGCRCAVVPMSADEATDGAMESGMERLPLLAQMEVPQPGFRSVFA